MKVYNKFNFFLDCLNIIMAFITLLVAAYCFGVAFYYLFLICILGSI